MMVLMMMPHFCSANGDLISDDGDGNPHMMWAPSRPFPRIRQLGVIGGDGGGDGI